MQDNMDDLRFTETVADMRGERESEQQEACIYCDELSSDLSVPAVDDDEAWKTIALNHAPGCEWVETRAHRIRF